ncbi:hypothetical protein PRZ48_005992 [Zasmidium cellare]|uniref:FAD-binding domain-containing protein n=1 Tax=Zasmidium cellare TaxID=395010 RepID=A0ABR0EN31_ZASCE|nr:hypothetical protein PRZ48_005992 [Zasmidium cellare]
MPAPERFTVAVIGGGIGGLTLALGLLELPNISVHIYEKAKAFGEVGLGVNIAPNSQQALAKISPKTEEAFAAEATHNLWPSHANSFTTNVCGMQGVDDGKVITRQVNATGARSVHRAKFLGQLVKRFPSERAHFNKCLMTIDQPDVRSTDKLTLHFKDGSTASADAVVGADGIHSHVRNAVLSREEHVGPHYTGCVCFRSIVPMPEAVRVLGKEYAENCHLLCGEKAAIFSYPVEHGESLNIIMMDFDHPHWDAPTWIVPSDKNELKRILKGWNKTAEGLVELMDTNVDKWAMHDLPHLPYYHKGRVVLMGDAAHATTPFQGQGAGQAIEDSLTLKTLLAACETKHDIRAAFRAFDLARRARTQSVVTTSRRSGAITGMMLEGIGSDIGKMKEELDMCYQWMWNRDLDDQNREALLLMKEAEGYHA